MERRKVAVSKSNPLPHDYVSMVNEVFNAHFESTLEAFNKVKPQSRFETFGEISINEIIVAISLVSEGALAATTVYASIDFDPKATSPNVQDLLSACIDALGSVFTSLLTPDNMENVADESLTALENVPFDWTLMEANQTKVYVKIDKSNLKLDALAQEWLVKHDPKLH